MVVVNLKLSVFCWLFSLCHLACSNSELYEGVRLIHKTNTELTPVTAFIRATQWAYTQMRTDDYPNLEGSVKTQWPDRRR
jgi:hypothetical protein